MKRLSKLLMKSALKKLKKSNILFMVCLCFLIAWMFLNSRGVFGIPSFFYGDQARLYVAVAGFNRVKEVKRLVKSKNVDINSQNNGIGTFLEYAVIDIDEVEDIEVLLDHGARINQRDANGFTPLMAAVFYKNPAAVKLLVERGADINLGLKSGGRNVTALDLAKREIYGYQEIISILEAAAEAKKRETEAEVERQGGLKL